MSKLKTHWAADMYPLNAEDVDSLAADIRAHGQVSPIKMLKDGRIVDGRNRWLACQKAGVDPSVDIINPDGREVPDDEVFAIATSCNAMRRDLTASARACLAAEAWRRLYPGETRGGDVKRGAKVQKCTFETFAKANFKVGERYAKMAQAILNHDASGDLFKEAQLDLPRAYDRCLAEKEERRKRAATDAAVQRHPDLAELVSNGKLSTEDAVAAVEKREEEERQNKAAAERDRARVSVALGQISDHTETFRNQTAEEIAACYKPSDYSRIGKQPISESLAALSVILKDAAKQLEGL